MEGGNILAKVRQGLVILAFMVTACMGIAGNLAVAADSRGTPRLFSKEYFERLEYYESRYPEEIFQFCENLYLKKMMKLEKCLNNQLVARKKILARARHQTGSKTLAQVIYDDCVEHHPNYGVGRIVACVETRLILYERVNDIAIERFIYQKCESKWRRSGASAIDVCCANEGRYYKENGRLRD